MITQPPEPSTIPVTATKALNLVNLLATCHTLEDCTALDRAQALELLRVYLYRILEQATRGSEQPK